MKGTLRNEDKTQTIYVMTTTMAIYNENYAQITDSEGKERDHVVSQICDQPLTGQATGQATGHATFFFHWTAICLPCYVF